MKNDGCVRSFFMMIGNFIGKSRIINFDFKQKFVHEIFHGNCQKKELVKLKKKERKSDDR